MAGNVNEKQILPADLNKIHTTEPGAIRIKKNLNSGYQVYDSRKQLYNDYST